MSVEPLPIDPSLVSTSGFDFSPSSSNVCASVGSSGATDLLARGPALFGPFVANDDATSGTAVGDNPTSLAVPIAHDANAQMPRRTGNDTSTPLTCDSSSIADTSASRSEATSKRTPPTVDLAALLHLASTPLPLAATARHFSDEEDEDLDEGTSTAELSGTVPPGEVPAASAMQLPVGGRRDSCGKSAPKAKANRSRITSWLRSRVSQNKVRFRDEHFNLDLTYITHRIIAMGYPAHGTEYYIRNPIDKVEAFLDQRHPQHFRVYNLCSERHYDNSTRFHGQFKCFPFDDHNAPALGLMCDFVADAAAFLAESVKNVVVVHCKAGKGRTGIMVSCLLFRLFPQRFSSGQKAMEYFNVTRTCDGAGLTIPSQQRYVEYYERILRVWNGIPPAVGRSIGLVEVVVNKAALQQPLVNHLDFYFLVTENDRPKLDSRLVFPRGPLMNEVGMVFAFPKPYVRLQGGIKVTFYRRRPMVLSGNESPGFYIWFDTNFCESNSVILPRNQLDKVDEATFTKTTTVGFRFADATAPQSAAPVPPTA